MLIRLGLVFNQKMHANRASLPPGIPTFPDARGNWTPPLRASGGRRCINYPKEVILSDLDLENLGCPCPR